MKAAAWVFIFLLIVAILAMFVLYAENKAARPVSAPEPVNPIDTGSKPQIQISQINDEKTLNVYTDGKIVKMDLEVYVLGVLSAEMPASFPPEALKAQAVAARTYAVYRVLHGGCSKHAGADVCNDSGHCQAYHTDAEQRGIWKDRYDEYTAKLTLAVRQTAGKIMEYESAPILALYHSSSAGYTEDVSHVYSQTLPYLVSVPSPGDGSETNLETRVEFSRKSFADTVNKAYPKAKLIDKSLEKQVSVTSRYTSGRVQTVKLGGASITGVEFRRLFGIRSANFTIQFDKNAVIVTTEGFGHGVGMSQYGADAMAMEGATYADILTHYYTGIQITSLK